MKLNEEASAKRRAIYRSKIEFGLCVKCGKQNDRIGKVHCTSCRKEILNDSERRRRVRARYCRRRENGICTSCGIENSTPQYAQCPLCRKRVNLSGARSKQRKKRSGICTNCFRTTARPGRTSCQACAVIYKDRAYRKNYGLSLAEIATMLETQGSLCCICARDISRSFVVDHCHATGIVRGLLCRRCNTNIGGIETLASNGLLEKSMQYLALESGAY